MTTYHSPRRPRPQARWTRYLNEPTLLPAGQDWDAIRIRAAVGTRAMRHLELCGVPVGPVLHDRGNDHPYFLTPPGTARAWQREHTHALGSGSWVVLASPGWTGDLLHWLTDPADGPAHTAPDHLAQALTVVTAQPHADGNPPMLTKPPQWGFWCECWTENLTEQGPPALVASFDACSAPQADRWVSVALRTISPALDSDASTQAWEWMYDGRIDTRRALLRAEPCTVSLTHADTRITWTIRPVLFLPLAHRQGGELPGCAHYFTSRSAE